MHQGTHIVWGIGESMSSREVMEE
ncbi:Protein of unknown function [Bacillus wiedmannii]|nr:Protein of unknown function [Bacillus wiedmannii]